MFDGIKELGEALVVLDGEEILRELHAPKRVPEVRKKEIYIATRKMVQIGKWD